jgi:hypothetical protein
VVVPDFVDASVSRAVVGGAVVADAVRHGLDLGAMLRLLKFFAKNLAKNSRF